MSTATATKTGKKSDAPVTEHKYSDAVKTLAEIYKPGISFAKDGTPTIADGLIESNLPEDVTMAQIKRGQKVRSEIVSALSLAMWEKGKGVLTENPELPRIEASFKFGNDKIDLGLERQREFNDGSGGKVVKYGHLSVGYTATGATNAGDFKKVRTAISDEAQKLFG